MGTASARPERSKFSKMADVAPMSKDVEDRRSGESSISRHVKQGLINAKENLEDWGVTKSKLTPDPKGTKGFESNRATRDLGGPRTPPYGGKQ